ncbi:hypothetical protein [Flavobacterium anhuiense]|uniref:hypothetical protein n=1 Tax=Flavobacterium anhuiense TaxID=459526 RepID=UPI00202731A9|nr:hypothetical protein [Flavobacterium anhuiense]URM35220.1 hypothetical protein LLY39_12230 [Flavobacterium anhuiense]
MKNVFLIATIFIGLNMFAQEIPNRLIDPNKPIYSFEFDEKIDKAIYNKIQGVTVITDFEIALNGKKVSFYSIGIDENEKLFVNTTRQELEEIIKNDNINKQPCFFIFFKKENKYYAVDYMLRSIND